MSPQSEAELEAGISAVIAFLAAERKRPLRPARAGQGE